MIFARTNLRKDSIEFAGSKLWNVLLTESKASSAAFCLKKLIRKHP